MANSASYSGSAVSIPAASSNEFLTWDTLGAGDELFDRSNPTEPEVLQGGIYAVTVSIQSFFDFSTGGGCHITVHLDFRGEDSVCEATVSGAAVDFNVVTCLNNTYYVPTGGVIAATVRNLEPSSRDYWIREALVQLVVADEGARAMGDHIEAAATAEAPDVTVRT